MPAPSTPSKPNSNGAKPVGAAAAKPAAAGAKPASATSAASAARPASAAAAKPGTQKVGAGAAVATKPAPTGKLPAKGGGNSTSNVGGGSNYTPIRSGGKNAPSKGGGNPMYLFIAIGVLVVGVGGMVAQTVFFGNGNVSNRFEKGKGGGGPAVGTMNVPASSNSGNAAAGRSDEVSKTDGKTPAQIMAEEAQRRLDAANKALADGSEANVVSIDYISSLSTEERTGDPNKVVDGYMERLIKDNLISAYKFVERTSQDVEVPKVEGAPEGAPTSVQLVSCYYIVDRLDSNRKSAGREMYEFQFVPSDPTTRVMMLSSMNPVAPGSDLWGKYMSK